MAKLFAGLINSLRIQSLKRTFIVLLFAASIFSCVWLLFQLGLCYALVHSFINIFAGGRSNAKVILFFVYLAGLALLSAAPALQNEVRADQCRRGIIALAALLYGIGFAAMVWLFKVHGFSLKQAILVGNNNELSSTILTHNHLLKAPLASALGWLHVRSQENYDTGLAFVHLLPSILSFLVLGLSLVLFILIFVYFFYAPKPKTGITKIAYVILFGIVTFSLLKNIFDGGILNREAPVACAGLILIFWPHSLKAKQAACGLLALYALFFFGWWRMQGVSDSYLLKTAVQYAVFALMLWGMWLFAMGNARNKKYTAVIIASLIVVVSYAVQDALLVESYRQNIVTSKNPAIVSAYEPIYDSGYTLVETIGSMNIYDFHPEAPVTVDALLRRHNLLDNVVPITLPGVMCDPRGPSLLSNYIVNTPYSFDRAEIFFKTVRIDLIKQLSVADNGWNRYRITVHTSPCSPRPINIVHEILRSAGVTTFILTNPNYPYSNDF